MSCFPESTWAFYVDGELAPDEVRAVERHLVACRGCRALVLGLREEASLLADVLHERAPRSFARAPRTAPPPRELAVGVLPLAGLGALALAVLGWLVETGLPGEIGWLNPFRVQGAYEMAFDLLFLLRDDAPGLVRMASAVAAMASLALALFFAVSLLGRRLERSFALVLGLAALLGALGGARPAAALELRLHEEEVEIAADETVERTLVVNADTVRVDGVVEGDLVVFLADRLILRGEVHGNVFATARTVEVPGRIEGNLHAIGEKVRLDGEVEGNMYSVAELVTVAQRARVGRDATHLGAGVSVEGAVERDLFALARWVEVRGRVGRHVDARADRVALGDGAEIGGDVEALFWHPGEVEVAPGAQVAGEVSSRLVEEAKRSRLERYGEIGFYVTLILRVAAAFVLGMVLYLLVPQLFAVHLETARGFLRSLGLGFLAAVATPVAVALVGITIVGLPVALLGLAAFLASVYVGGILVAALLGTQVTRLRREGWRPFALALGVGLVLIVVAGEIPWLGVPLRILVALAGLGLMVERLRAAWEVARGEGGAGAPAP